MRPHHLWRLWVVGLLLIGAPARAVDSNVTNVPEWAARFNGDANNFDEASAVAVSPNGSVVFVTGLVDGIGPDEMYATVAYSTATGNELWVSHYNGSPCVDAPTAIAVNPAGTAVFVTGASGCVSQEDYATVAYDATNGEELWVKRYDGPTGDPDEPSALAVSPDGARVFVTGRSFGLIGQGRDYATVAYDSGNGNQAWVKRYVGPGVDEKTSDDEANAVVVSPDGSRVFVTGQSYGASSGPDFATVSYRASDGQQDWVARYDGTAGIDDGAKAIGISPDGSKVLVTGYSFGTDTFTDLTTLSYNAGNGHEQWVRRFDGGVNGFDYGNALAVSPVGSRVYVTGYADLEGLGSTDYQTIAYDLNGAVLWSRSYDGPAHNSDTANGLAVSPDGARVYVTGLSSGVTNDNFPFDSVTLAYKSGDGSVDWLGRFNGPANESDSAQAVVVSPDSHRVMVTGFSAGVGSGFDYMTIQYDAHPILLRIERGPGAGEVHLSWEGGLPLFDVYRAEQPANVITPVNRIATTADSSWIDSPPASGLECYVVAGE